MKQTAVEWLVEKFNQCEPMYSGIQSLEHKQYLDDLIKQAKAMEKKQIKDAWLNSLTKGDYNSAEEYYNETF